MQLIFMKTEYQSKSVSTNDVREKDDKFNMREKQMFSFSFLKSNLLQRATQRVPGCLLLINIIIIFGRNRSPIKVEAEM